MNFGYAVIRQLSRGSMQDPRRIKLTKKVLR